MSETPVQFSSRSEVSLGPAMGLLAQGSVFWKPDFLAASAWLEHVPALFWLVEAVQPNNTVVLGANSGVSHFAVCQAVARLRLGAACYVVNPQFANSLTAYNEKQYAAFSQCLSMPLQSTAGQFEAESVDLLLINGAQENAQEVLNAWLPKLSAHAVVAVCGVARREPGHAGQAVFASLGQHYPTVAFNHGGGLGIAVVGNSPRTLVTRLLELAGGGSGMQVARDVFARLGRACFDAWQSQQQQGQSAKLQAALKSHQQQLEELSGRYDTVQKKLASREEEVGRFSQRMEQSLERHAQERGTLAEKVSNLQALKQTLEQEVERLRFESQESRRLVDQRTEQLLALQKDSTQHVQALEQLKYQGQTRETELEQVKGWLNARKQEVDKLKQQLEEARSAGKDSVEKASKAAQVRVQEAENRAKEMEARVEVAEKRAVALQAQLKGAEEKTSQTEQKISELRSALEASENRARLAETALVKQKEEASAQHNGAQTELTRLREQAEAFEAQIAHRDYELARVKDEAAQARSRANAVDAQAREQKAGLQERDEQIHALQGQLSGLQHEAEAQLKEAAQKHQLEIRRLQTVAQQRERDVKRLQQVLAERTQAVAKLNETISALKQAEQNSKARQAELSRALVLAKEEAAQARMRADAVDAQLKEAAQKHQLEIRRLQTVAQQRERDVKRLQLVLAERTQAVTKLNETISVLKQAEQNSKVRQAELSRALVLAKEEIDSRVRAAATQLLEQRKEANAALNKRQSEYRHLQLHFQEREKLLEQRDFALKELEQQLVQQTQQHQVITNQYQAELQGAQEALQARLHEMAHLSQQLENKTAEIVTLTELLQEQEAAVEQRDRSLEVLKNEHAKASQTAELTQAELGKAQEALDAAKRVAQQAQADAVDTKKALQQKQQEIQRIEQALQQVKQEAEQTKQQLAKVQAELKTAKAQNEAQNKSLVQFKALEMQLQQKLSEKNDELVVLTQWLEQMGGPPEAQVAQRSSVPAVQDNASASSGGTARRGWLFGGGSKRKPDERHWLDLIARSNEFDAQWYLTQYSDVASHPEFAKDPARHYLKFGGFEGRNPGPGFDSEAYLQLHPKLRESGMNPLVHYLTQRQAGTAAR